MRKPLKLLRLPEVLDRTGLRKSAVYELIQAGRFPRPVKIGAASRWPEGEIDDALEALIAERDAAPASSTRGRAA